MELLTTKSNEGDTAAYRHLRHIYYYSGHVKEFLYNALTMAEVNDYPLAYYDVYTILYPLDEENKKINKLADYYLFLAYKKNAEHAKTTIEERFGKSFKVPELNEYWIEINK